MQTSRTTPKRKNLGNKVIYLSRGHYNGKATWHYLLVDKMKLPILLKEAKSGEIDLAHYGNIILSGFGEMPPEEVRHFVQKQYGRLS